MHRTPEKLVRKAVPNLPRDAAIIGREGVVRRSFDRSAGDILRVFCGEPLELTLEFNAPAARARVVCYTNLNRAHRSWRAVPFEKQGSVYHLSIESRRCGIFGFRIKYSFDDGKTWIWDRVPVVHVHVDPEASRDVRMYTLIPSVSGTVDHWIDRIDPIREMGFNMIHLLPVTQMGASRSPYSAGNLFTLDPAYWDPARDTDGMDAFERFVEAAKARRMGLCVDLVLNHISPGSRLSRRAPDWIIPDREELDGMKRSGCWHMNSWLKWGDLVKLYYDHPNKEKREAVWDYMRAYALFWANYAAYTGGMVRLDNLHNSDEDFIAFILVELRKAYPDLVVHAEFFSDANTVLRRAREWDLNLFLANPWEYPYAENLRDYLRYLHDISGSVLHHVPVTTHDTGAPAELFGAAEAVIPRYFITALLATGKTGMVQGCEHGVPEKVEFIGHPEPFPYAPDPRLVDRIGRINRLLAREDCLHTPKNLTFVDEGHGAVVAAFRGDDPGSGLLLAANLDIENPHWLVVDLQSVTERKVHRLEDVLDEAPAFHAGGRYKISLPACGVAAFRVTAGPSG